MAGFADAIGNIAGARFRPEPEGQTLYHGKSLNSINKWGLMGKEAKETLQQDILSWNKSINEIEQAGGLPSNPVKILNQTPLIFGLLDNGINSAAKNGLYASPSLSGRSGQSHGAGNKIRRQSL